MNQAEIEEFDVYYQFAYNIKVLPPLMEREFVHTLHLVSCSGFVIHIEYNKNSYGDRIKGFVQRVIKMCQQSCLPHYRWAVKLLIILIFQTKCR